MVKKETIQKKNAQVGGSFYRVGRISDFSVDQFGFPEKKGTPNLAAGDTAIMKVWDMKASQVKL